MFNQAIKNKSAITTVALLILVGMIVVAVRWDWKKNDGAIFPLGKDSKSMAEVYTEKVLIVETDAEVKKVDLAGRIIEDVAAFEKGDCSEFEGLPTLQDFGKLGDVQQKTIFSTSKKEFIIALFSGDENDPQRSSGGVDYICDVKNKKCREAQLLKQEYKGLDAALQKNENSFVWSAWDSEEGLLFGNPVSNDAGDISPVYICDTEKKICEKTEGYDWKKEGDGHAIVPNGSLSPTLGKFAMVLQNDEPNIETGKTWELLVFQKENVSKPVRTYDLSVIIDRDENVAYDAVHSVSWSGDEKKLAIGTSRRIFMLDLETGVISLVYIAQTDEEGDFYWDSNALFLSGDAKSIAFVDESDDVSKSADDEAEDVSVVNVLNKIDLENENQVSQLMSAEGLSLK